MAMTRSKRKWVLLVVSATVLLGGAFSLPEQQAKPVVQITARMFDYTPARIELKKGQPVVLALTSLDRIHGFHIPGLGVRADVLPGQTVEVEILPKQVGRLPFLCDLFCGDGHDEMSGVIVVTESP